MKVLGAGGLPSHDARRHGSEPSLGVSLDAVDAILTYCDDADIRMYRMATQLAPYASHPDLTQFRDQPQRFAERLAEVGARARGLGIRLSTHPGQYTVLNSEDARIQRLAVEELEVQSELFDGMGLGPESVIILHVGGAAGGLQAAADRFVAGFELLSESARGRIVVENDDRTFALGDVLGLSQRVGRPVVWDILHRHCNDPERIPDREALQLALGTWPDRILPKIHYSTPKTAVEEKAKKVGRRVERSLVLPQLRAHADVIDPIAFEHFVTQTAAGSTSTSCSRPRQRTSRSCGSATSWRRAASRWRSTGASRKSAQRQPQRQRRPPERVTAALGGLHRQARQRRSSATVWANATSVATGS